jgi:hypothetical protein
LTDNQTEPAKSNKPQTRVVILNGGDGVGKAEFLDFVREHCACRVSAIRLTDPVRDWLRQPPMAWSPQADNGSESDHDRTLIRAALNLWQSFNDGPFQLVLRKAERAVIECTDRCVVFIQAREGYFISRILEHFRAQRPDTRPVTLMIDRPGTNSDGFIGFFGHDYIVHHIGQAQDLEIEAIQFLEWLGDGYAAE